MRDKEHLAHIRSLPCLICGKESIAHHVRSYWTSGMGTKPPDRMTLPLCVECHTALHQTGEKRFWAYHGINEFEEVCKINFSRDPLLF